MQLFYTKEKKEKNDAIISYGTMVFFCSTIFDKCAGDVIRWGRPRSPPHSDLISIISNRRKEKDGI